MTGPAEFPPDGPVTFQKVIPSYLYKQYEDDDDLQTFVASQNYLAQKWLDDFNSLSLPVWSALSGDLLDWVGRGLYGIRRPILSYQKPAPIGAGSGPYATMPYNALPYAGGRLHPANTNPVSYLPVTDDIYKRILTWHLYRGDGFQFSTRWLKRRVHRFINGLNGYLPTEDNTYDVSVTTTGAAAVTITVTANEIGTAFQYAVIDGVLALPFQITFTVEPTTISFPDAASGRVLGAAGFGGNLIVAGRNFVGQIAGAAGISGNLLAVSGTRLLLGRLDAAAMFGGDARVVVAAGTTTWAASGTIGATAGIGGSFTVRGAMGGVFRGDAG